MATVVNCPICRTPVIFEDNPFRPFCSERCKLIDLGAWAGGKYRIAGEPVEEEPADEADEGNDRKRKRPN